MTNNRFIVIYCWTCTHRRFCFCYKGIKYIEVAWQKPKFSFKIKSKEGQIPNLKGEINIGKCWEGWVPMRVLNLLLCESTQSQSWSNQYSGCTRPFIEEDICPLIWVISLNDFSLMWLCGCIFKSEKLFVMTKCR